MRIQPSDIMEATTRRDTAAYCEQAQLAVARRREERGLDGSFYRQSAAKFAAERVAAEAEAVRCFELWVAQTEPAHDL